MTSGHKREEEDVLLRVYVSETTLWKGKPLYEAIVLRARESGMAGATVFRGIFGYGADQRLHSARLLDLSDNMPVVVEIIDREEAVERFLPFLEESVQDGFVTMEKIHVLRYRNNK